jgi:hypothetical protein
LANLVVYTKYAHEHVYLSPYCYYYYYTHTYTRTCMREITAPAVTDSTYFCCIPTLELLRRHVMNC